jgi:DNA invertase Pin-like site-specific DNA recombinase
MAGIRVGYVRVSTPEQHPERQMTEMKADKFYVDIYTGKVLERPQFQAMMSFIREGDTLVVHSLDRLARNLTDLRNTVLGLVDKGITVEFITEKLIFDKTPSSFGLLLLSMMGAFAEFERNLTRERSISGIANARAKGIKCGGRKPRFTPEILKQIEKMHKEGAEIKLIAKYIGISRTSVYNYMKLKGPATRKRIENGNTLDNTAS